MGGHADMVFLIGAGGGAVGDGRMGEVLVLAHQGRRRHLGDHQAGVQPRIGRQEGGQIEAERGVHHQGHPALGNRPDFGQGQRDHVGSKAHGFGVEVASRHDLPVRQDQRIVGGGIRLDLQRGGGHAQHVHRRPRHLRLAADAIGVLHPAVASDMAFADFGPRQQGAHGRRRLDLAGMAAQRVDFGMQGRGGPHDGIGGQG